MVTKPGRGGRGTADFLLATKMGLLSNYDSIYKFGRNTDVDTTTDPEDVWTGGGLWVPPTQSRVHNIASTSANDNGTQLSTGNPTTASSTALIDSGATFSSDGVAAGDLIVNDTQMDYGFVESVDSETQLTFNFMNDGTEWATTDTYRVVTAASTGTGLIKVIGLDSNWDETSEFIIMNGTSNVATASMTRIYRMYGILTGSNNSNVGKITATAVTDGTVTAEIAIGFNQTEMAIYTIPNGKTGYLSSVSAYLLSNNSSNHMAAIQLIRTPHADQSASERVVLDGAMTTYGWQKAVETFDTYIKFKQRTDVKLRVSAVTVDNLDIAGNFEIILVDN